MATLPSPLGEISNGPGLWFDFAHHPEPVEGPPTSTSLCLRPPDFLPRNRIDRSSAQRARSEERETSDIEAS